MIQETNLDSMLSTYKSRPGYYVQFSSTGCLYEIRVNDDFVDKIADAADVGGTVVTINPNILHSGKQKVSVILKPNPGETVIKYRKPFTMKIGYQDFMEDTGNAPRTWHWVYEMPPVEVPSAGLPHFEFEAEFEAEVPYSIISYSNCKDLRNIPDIEQRVVAKFNEVHDWIVNRNFRELHKMNYKKNYELAASMYESDEEFKQRFKEDEDDYVEVARNIQPIEDYDLVFYADGRMVTLESKKEGWWFPSAILSLHKDDDETVSYNNLLMFFGIREGSDELELIM